MRIEDELVPYPANYCRKAEDNVRTVMKAKVNPPDRALLASNKVNIVPNQSRER
jgi:hypothetical protein